MAPRLLPFALLLATPALAQFTVLHIGAPGSSLEDIHFPTPLVGYAVGKDGAAYKSIDGGATWNALSTGSGAYLFGVHFLDADLGFVSGGGATVLRTTDGGGNWTPLTLPFTECVYQVQPLSASVIKAGGWGGYFFRSVNGGDDWTIGSVDAANQGWIFGMQFIDADNGWVGGADGRINRTSNGGLDWEDQDTPTGNALRAISFGDAQHGFAAGFFGTVLRTVNGGDEWTTINTGYPGDSYYGAHFTDALNGVICGGFYASGNWQGAIMRTNDGGDTWERIHSGGPVLNGITINNGSIFAVGANEVVVSDVLSTGIADAASAESLVIHPNPATQQCRIELLGGALPDRPRVEVFDARGARVYARIGASGDLDVSAWEPGPYTVRLIRGEVTRHVKLIVQR